MGRWGALLLNLGLVLFSICAAVCIVRVCDRTVGVSLVQRLWPGPTGLLFVPNSEHHWEMHDYSCAEYINSLGFRDREVPLKKTCTYRIVAIGDSFTYGWGVNIGDAWCKHLERNLRQAGMDVEVLDLGKPGAGPTQYASLAEIAVPVLKPDLVIVGCLAGDDLQQAGPPKELRAQLRQAYPNLTQVACVCRNYLRFGSVPPLLKRSVSECRKKNEEVAKELIAKMDTEQWACFARIEGPVKKYFRRGMLNPWLIAHSTGSPEYFMNTLSLNTLQYQIKWTTEAFLRIKNITARYGIEAIVLSIPEGFYVNKEAFRNVQRIGFHVVPEMLNSDVADDAVRLACGQSGLSFHCVTDEFRKHADNRGLYFELDRHFTAAGNALYADLVTPLLAHDIGDAAKPRAK